MKSRAETCCLPFALKFFDIFYINKIYFSYRRLMMFSPGKATRALSLSSCGEGQYCCKFKRNILITILLAGIDWVTKKMTLGH